MASNSESDEKESLAKIFQEGLDLYNHLGKIDEPTNSSAVQVYLDFNDFLVLFLLIVVY